MVTKRHKKEFPVTRFRLGVFQIGLILAVLYIVARYNYLLFHSLTEFFTAAIGVAVFLLAWNARKYARNNFYLFLGTAFATVAVLRIIHAVAYRGMDIIPGTIENSNPATQLWLASQFVLGGSLAAAPFLLGKKMRVPHILFAYLALFGAILLAIFHWGVFPAAYVEGTGLTMFKKTGEYAVAALFLVSMYFFWRKKDLLDSRVLKLFAFVNGLLFLATLSFTLYVGVYGFFNELGHLFSVAAFYGGYLAIVEFGLMRPYNLLFQEVKMNEDRWRAIVDDQEELVCRFNPADGVLTFANNAYCRYFGKPAEKLVGTSYWKHVPGPDLERDQTHIAALTPEQSVGRIEHMGIDGGGNLRWQHWTTRAIFDEEKNLVECQSVGRDMTERKHADEALRKSEERYRDMADNALVGIYRADLEGNYLYVNEAMAKMFEFGSPEEMMREGGKMRYESQEERERFHKLLKEKGRIVNYELIGKTKIGRRINVLSNAMISGNERTGMILDITERKLAEAALKESERKYHSLFSKMIDGFALHKMIYDRSGKPCDYVFLEVNRAFENITGLRRENILGKRVTEVIPGIKNDPADWIGKYGEVAFFGKEISFENHSAALGKWFEVSAYSPKKDHFVSLFTDITQRKKIEESLRLSKEEWERTFDSVPDLVAILDTKHRIKRVNKAMAKRLGTKPEKCIGLNCFRCVHNSNKPILNCPHSLTLADGKEHVAEIEEKNLGGIFLVSTTPLFGNKGELVGSVHVARDITGRKRAEKALKESETSLKRAQEMAHLGSWELDLQKNRLFWSDEVYRIFGLKPRQFGATYEAFLAAVHPDDRKTVGEAYSASVRENRNTYEIEHRIVRSDGEIRFVHEKCEHFRDKSGKIIRSLGMVHDITEKKKIDQTKDEFISLASHQLRTPLSSISLSSELLLRGISGKIEKEQKEFLEEINKGAKKMSLLVNNLLNVSRLEMGTFEIGADPLAVSSFVKNRLKEILPLVKDKNIFLDRKIEEDIPVVSFNENSFGIVLDNFLSNALRYTPAGGRISVELKKEKGNVILRISDTGCGIPATQKEKVFEKSFRADNAKKLSSEGAGLGLYMVKSIADLTGSGVWFDSTLGKGTTFYFSIPV